MRLRTAKTSTTQHRSLVGFIVGGVRYALRVDRVRQIVNPMPTTPLPHMPHSILGVAEHRGEVIPVMDLRVYYGAPIENTKRTKWILLDIGNRLIGVVVDAVTGVFASASEELRAAPVLGEGDAQRGIAGVASHEGAMVFVVDTALLQEIARPVLSTASQASPTPSASTADRTPSPES
jgi:purine-binding chemotaxis protein CheW